MPARELKTWTGRLKNLAHRFTEDKCPVMAAALSFFTLLSVVPVLLVAIGALAIFTGSTYQATQHIQKLVVDMLPGKTAQQAFLQLAQQIDLHGFVHNLKHAGPRNLIVGVLVLLWAAVQIFVNASGTLNAAFEAEETRSWIKLRLICFGVMAVSLVLFLLSIVATSGPDMVSRILPKLGIPNPAPWPVNALFFLLALALNICMFAVVYRFLPNAYVSWRSAFVGGTVMGILWVIATKAMTLFLANPNKMYGALGGVVLIITWMYYSNMLLLFGAEVSALYAKIKESVAVPSVEEERRHELHAVHAGQAVPLTAAPRGSGTAEAIARMQYESPKDRAKERAQDIRHHVQTMGDAIRHMLHDIHTIPERNRTKRGLRPES